MQGLEILTAENLALETRRIEIAPGRDVPVSLERYCWETAEDVAAARGMGMTELCRVAVDAVPAYGVDSAVVQYVIDILRSGGWSAIEPPAALN